VRRTGTDDDLPGDDVLPLGPDRRHHGRLAHFYNVPVDQLLPKYREMLFIR